FQAEDGIRDRNVTGVQTCALPISAGTQLWGNIRAMADSDKEERCGYCGAGYAPFGHQERQRPDGNLSQRYCSPGIVFCGRKRTEIGRASCRGGVESYVKELHGQRG